MPAVVPTLEGQMFLKDPEWIIAYQWKRYARQPDKTIPILSELIISLPKQISKFGKHPDVLCRNIETDLQGVLSRVFGTDRSISVAAIPAPTSDTLCTITVTFTYGQLTGEVGQIGTSIALDPSTGRLVLPVDTFPDDFYLKA